MACPRLTPCLRKHTGIQLFLRRPHEFGYHLRTMRTLATGAIVVAAALVMSAQQSTPLVRLSGAEYADIVNAYGRMLHAASVGNGTSFAQTFGADGEVVLPGNTVSGRT